MKIKEVSQKTDLTQKAIRLYIENGLVEPSIEESYSGRRNIDFSQADVEKLKNISVLRKVGFSIPEIKQLQQEPENCKEILRCLVRRIESRIDTDTLCLTYLVPLLSENNLDIEKICISLNKPIVDEKTLPAEDTEISPVQKLIRKLFLAVGIIGMVFALACFIPIAKVEIRDIMSYLYPQYYMNYILLFVALSLLLPIPIIVLNRKDSFHGKKKQKLKSFISLLLICVFVYCSFFTFAAAFLASTSSPESYVVSRTKDTGNYMIFDVEDAEKVMKEFLPEKLPDVKDIKYEYFYKEHGVAHEPPRTRVFLEFPLDSESFYKTVDYYKAFRPADSICEPYEEKQNHWTIIFYREDHEHAPSNYAPIFAFNEDEYKVRFICEYGQVSQKGVITRDLMIRSYIW